MLLGLNWYQVCFWVGIQYQDYYKLVGSIVFFGYCILWFLEEGCDVVYNQGWLIDKMKEYFFCYIYSGYML